MLIDGSVDELFKIETSDDAPLYQYLRNLISSNLLHSSRIINESSLLGIMKAQKDGHSFWIDRIHFDADKNEISPNGAGVFQNDGTYVGDISRTEREYMHWIGRKSGSFSVNCTIENQMYAFYCNDTLSKLSVTKDDNDIFTLRINLDAEFTLNEYDYVSAEKVFDKEFFETAEKSLESVVKNQCEEILNIAKTRLKTDFIGFGRAVEDSYPNWWDNNKNEWNKIFADSSYELDINCTVISSGSMR